LDLNKLIADEISQLQFRAQSNGVKLIYTPPKKPVPIVKLDEDKTKQVVMNLIDNAISYAPKGEVTVSLDSNGKEIVYKVSDNGIGIPKSQQNKLFGKFFRASNAQKTKPDGTGLGLYLVKRVVEDQGGEVIFESEEGKGSTFGFKLPIKAKS
ncbi:MAG: HAMP domain-containing sensor histidine kinase, partial [bacterium]|nr:HAMP domain-containing sensor histidine kinase [bacterium]